MEKITSMTNLSYKTCKELKDAGFPQHKPIEDFDLHPTDIISSLVKVPTLEELIAACGDGFGALLVVPCLLLWTARGNGIEAYGETPEEAVANL